VRVVVEDTGTAVAAPVPPCGAGDGSAARPRLRADASRNRRNIVRAAREALGAVGLDVPLDEIARRAGVGNATLYRNFADRCELFRTVLLDALAAMTACGETALAEEPDAFSALERFVHGSADEGVGALCTLPTDVCAPDDPELTAARDRLLAVVRTIVDGARSGGQLRADIAVSDVVVVLGRLSRPLHGATGAVQDSLVHRHLQLLLDGMRAPARSTLPGSAPDLEELRAAASVSARGKPGSPENP